MTNERDGVTHDFARRGGIDHTEIVVPKNAKAEWALDRSALWNAAEASEKRKDARTAQEVEIALPHELSREQRIELTRAFATHLTEKYGAAVDIAIHEPHEGRSRGQNKDIRNHHAHLLMTTRQVGENGLGEKITLEWKNQRLKDAGLKTGPQQVVDIRKEWEQYANKALERAGIDARIDHRSHEDRGLEIEPTKHVGVHAVAIARKGGTPDRQRIDEAEAKQNAERISARPEELLGIVADEKDVFDLQDVARALHRYVDDPETYRATLAKVMASPALMEVENAQGAGKATPRYSLAHGPVLMKEEAVATRRAEIMAKPETILADLTQQKAVFTKKDIEKELHRWIDDQQEFQGVMSRLEQSRHLVELAPAEVNEKGRVTKPAAYTTNEMWKLERGMAESVDRMNRRQSHGVRQKHIDAAMSRYSTLRTEQREAVEKLLSGRQIAVMVGDAGTGKSFSMKVAKEAWEAQGYRVVGAALAGKAAAELQEGSGIKSTTLHSLERKWERAEAWRDKAALINAEGADQKAGRKQRLEMAQKAENNPDLLRKGDVIVIDEAGMLGSRQLARVIAKIEQAGAKVVLVGDHKQFQAIEAGAPFRAILERTDPAKLTQIVRQKEEWAREASMALAAGAEGDPASVRKGLEAYEQRGHVRMHDTHEAARTAAALTYLAQFDEKKSSIILAHTNKDVQAINATVRAARRADGQIGEEATFKATTGERRFAVGDRLLFTENNKDLGVMKGQLGTVEQAETGKLTVKMDGGERREVDQSVYRDVDYGYAVTMHKSQGVTVDRAHVLASGGMDSFAAYVSMTRHREEATLYAGQDKFKDFEALASKLSQGEFKASTLDYDTAALGGFANRRGFDGEGAVARWLERGQQILGALEQRMGRAMEAVRERFGLPPAERPAGAQEGRQEPAQRPQGRAGEHGYAKKEEAKGERIYLTVPFVEKDQAKALGARFDGERKQWYAPPGADQAALNRWMPKEAERMKAPAPAQVQEAPQRPQEAMEAAEQAHKAETPREALRRELSALTGLALEREAQRITSRDDAWRAVSPAYVTAQEAAIEAHEALEKNTKKLETGPEYVAQKAKELKAIQDARGAVSRFLYKPDQRELLAKSQWEDAAKSLKDAQDARPGLVEAAAATAKQWEIERDKARPAAEKKLAEAQERAAVAKELLAARREREMREMRERQREQRKERGGKSQERDNQQGNER